MRDETKLNFLVILHTVCIILYMINSRLYNKRKPCATQNEKNFNNFQVVLTILNSSGVMKNGKSFLKDLLKKLKYSQAEDECKEDLYWISNSFSS